MTDWGRRDALFALSLTLAKVVLALAVFRAGFAQISDDDYARVVISESFAHSPKLDPSGTSWLPFPFWLQGSWLAAFGRSFDVARVFGVGVGAACPALFYAVARRAGSERLAAGSAAVLFATSPWCAWLSCAPIPEIPTALLTSAGLLLLARHDRRERWIGAVAIALACLSRYEPWAIAVLGGVLAMRDRSGGAKGRTALWLVPLVAPVLWMGWNLAVHGHALHFLHRVASYRRALGEGGLSLSRSLLLYPDALVSDCREGALALLVAIVGLFRGPASGEERQRLRASLAGILAVLAFLAYGSVRDGAPTHHPVRALVVVLPLVFLSGVETLARWTRSRRWLVPALVAGLSLYGLPRTLRAFPGQSTVEDRSAQLARGRELRRQGIASIRVVPCQFEHFALLAAFGAPERATIEPSTKRPVDPACPVISEDETR